jgi:uncharacterized protein YkwD
MVRPLLLALLAVTAVPPPSVDGVADSLLSAIRTARAHAAVPVAAEPAAAMRVARERAEAAARLRAGRRLSSDASTADALRSAGLRRVREVREYMQEQAGYADAAAAAMQGFRDHPLWARAASPEVTAIGAGAAQAADGTVLTVVLLIEEAPVRDLRAMESETERAVNRMRLQHGLPALVPSTALTGVARAHSDDMVRRRYFDHRDPDGLKPADRVKAAGVPASRVSENLAMNAGVDDPVTRAVDGWMESPGHRRNILDPQVTHTGVGIAEDDEGGYTFTQVFAALRPAAQ